MVMPMNKMVQFILMFKNSKQAQIKCMLNLNLIQLIIKIYLRKVKENLLQLIQKREVRKISLYGKNLKKRNQDGTHLGVKVDQDGTLNAQQWLILFMATH